jgi:hypothetical protein
MAREHQLCIIHELTRAAAGFVRRPAAIPGGLGLLRPLSHIIYNVHECLMLDIARLDRAFQTSLLCKTLNSALFFFSSATEQADFLPRRSRQGAEMSFAVPILLAVALAVSLSGQAGRFWPNYQSEQDEKSDKQDESKNKSDKGDEKSKSDQGSSSKNRPGKSDRNSTATSNGKRDTGSKGQD